MVGHVFVSYLREDAAVVDRLVAALRAERLTVWLDRDSIEAGQRWKASIHQAIRNGYLFIACFSRSYVSRDKSYMNEELTIAIEELRQRPKDRSWFIPVSLDGADIPHIHIGAGETLHDLQRLDFASAETRAVQMILRAAGAAAASEPLTTSRTAAVALAPAVSKGKDLKAKLAQIDERHASGKEWDTFIWSGESVPVAQSELKRLFATMQTLSSELGAQTRALKPEVEVAPPSCAMRLGRHTIVLSWLIHASNFVAKSKLYVLDYDRPYFLSGGNINVPDPPVVAKYDFARNRETYGWKSDSTFMTSTELAEWAVERLIAYLEKE